MSGNVLKVVACKVKPYELISRNEAKIDSVYKKNKIKDKTGEKQDEIDNEE